MYDIQIKHNTAYSIHRRDATNNGCGHIVDSIVFWWKKLKVSTCIIVYAVLVDVCGGLWSHCTQRTGQLTPMLIREKAQR